MDQMEMIAGLHKVAEGLAKVQQIHSIKIETLEKDRDQMRRAVEGLGALLLRGRNLGPEELLVAMTDASVAEMTQGNALAAKMILTAAAPLKAALGDS